MPGVAVAALRLLGALPDAPESRAVLEENLCSERDGGGRPRSSPSRASTRRGEPEKAAARADREMVAGTLEQRLGAAESLEFLGEQERGDSFE